MPAIAFGFVIVISNRRLRAKPKNACIIQPIAANATGKKSQVVLGYSLECSEASAKGKVYQKHGRKPRQNRRKYVILRDMFNKRNFEMSCFLLSDRHHASIARYVGAFLMWPDAKIQALADKLKRCNIASVNYRYDRQTPARKCKTVTYEFLKAKSYYDAIRCWAYQSCDNPGNVDYDVLRGFLFSLADPSFSPEMPVDQWGID